jgi:nitroreductase/NAD-dependent dihydropyrimidine dehydrogenase PreA subunit
MKEFYMNFETCTQCGSCVEVCPAMVLQKNRDGVVDFKQDNLPLCLRCGQCMAVCKTKSVYSNGMQYEKDFFEFSKTVDFFSIVEHRRSVRRFKPKPVSNEEIEKILYAVSQAPHGDSHVHVEITVVNNRDKIMEAVPLMSMFYDKLEKWLYNPIISRMIKFETGKDGLKALKNHVLPRIEKGIYRNISFEYDGITRGAHTLLIFHAPKDSEVHKEDSFILVTYATLAAQALGLGSTIIALIPPAINKSDELKRIFQIPADHETTTSLILGYPKYKYQRGIRKELKKVNWVN